MKKYSSPIAEIMELSSEDIMIASVTLSKETGKEGAVLDFEKFFEA